MNLDGALLHRRPAAVLEHDSEDRQLVLTRHLVGGARVAEVEAAVAGHVQHHRLRVGELHAERRARAVAQTAAAQTQRGAGLGAHDLHADRGLVHHRLGHQNVVLAQHLVEFGAQVGGVDQAVGALVLGKVLDVDHGLLALLAEGFEPRLGPGAVGVGELALDDFDQARKRLVAVRLHLEVTGEAPHRDFALDGVDVNVRPERVRVRAGFLRHPRQVGVDHETEVDLGQVRLGQVAQEHRRGLGNVQHLRVGLDHAHADELTQLVEQRRGLHVAPGKARDQQRILGRQQAVGDLVQRRVAHAAQAQRAVGIHRERGDLRRLPSLRQDLARQGHVDRPRRVALGHGERAAHGFLDDDAGRQLVLPLHVIAHDPLHVVGVLDEVHVRVAGAEQLAADGDRRGAGHQHQRNAGTERVVQTHGSVGGTGVHVHQHGLCLAGGAVVADRHVHRSVLVRAQDDLRVLATFLAPLGHGLDDRRVVGTHVAEQVIDADLVHRLQPIGGGHVGGRLLALRQYGFGVGGHGSGSSE